MMEECSVPPALLTMWDLSISYRKSLFALDRHSGTGVLLFLLCLVSVRFIGNRYRKAAHALWHSVYIGLGYLSNEVVTSYNDQVAYDKVQSLVPGTLYESPEYHHILRQQVGLIVWQHPQLVLYTVAAKLGVIGAMFLVFANVGLIAAERVRKPLGLELPFWIGSLSTPCSAYW